MAVLIFPSWRGREGEREGVRFYAYSYVVVTFVCLYDNMQLLQNLEYSDAVKVHLVNNGQEMMSFTDWDMSQFLA